jgi:hypothetical protein
VGASEFHPSSFLIFNSSISSATIASPARNTPRIRRRRFVAKSAPHTTQRTGELLGRTSRCRRRSTATRNTVPRREGESGANIHGISHEPIRPPNHEFSWRIERRRRAASYKCKREYAPERDRRASGSNNHSDNLRHSEYSRPRARRSQQKPGHINKDETDKKCRVGQRSNKDKHGYVSCESKLSLA